MTAPAVGLVALLGLAFAPPAEPTPRVLVDAVAAVVGRRVITLSELRAEASIVLVKRAGPRALASRIDAAFLDSVLDYVIAQELLLDEARHRGFTVTERSVDKQVAAFRARFRSDEDYTRFVAESPASDEDVRAVARRDLTVQALLRRALPPAEVVQEADAWAYIRAHPALVPGGPPARRLAAARAQLAKERQQRALTELLDAIRARVEVRVLGAAAGPSASDAGVHEVAGGG